MKKTSQSIMSDAVFFFLFSCHQRELVALMFVYQKQPARESFEVFLADKIFFSTSSAIFHEWVKKYFATIDCMRAAAEPQKENVYK